MSKKRKSRKNAEARPTNKRVKSERNRLLWQLVTEHADIIDTHVATKLNGNDVKFFYDVNRESRRAIKRSGVQLRKAFKIGDFDTKSTISWALEKCPEYKKARFCEQMARNGNVELLKVLHEKGCPWDIWTCYEAAKYGHLECLKYAHENGCPWDLFEDVDEDTEEDTCSNAAHNGHLECLKYAHKNGCPWDERTCFWAVVGGHLECLKYARKNRCPCDKWACEEVNGSPRVSEILHSF